MRSANNKVDNKADALAAAEALVRQREAEHRDATTARQRLESSISSGDDSVTGHDLTAAGDAITVSGSRLAYARTALAEAQRADSRARAQESPDVALALVRLLTGHAVDLGVYGIPVELVNDLPEQPNSPGLYVVQERATEHDMLTGTAAGECVLHFVAPVSRIGQVPALREGIRTVGLAEGYGGFDFGSIPMRDLGDGVVVLSTLVVASNLQSEVPVIVRDVQAWRLGTVETLLRCWVSERAGAYESTGVRIGAGNSATRMSQVRCVTEGQRVRSVETDSDGITRRNVETTLSVTSTVLDQDRLLENTLAAVDGLAGSFVAGVGRIESTAVRHVEPIPHGRRMAVSLVLVSRAV